MSYTTAITELRQLLSDSALHKKATNKKLIGAIDAVNTQFYTYDKRILEDTLDVLVNGVSTGFTVNDAVQGSITLSPAPELNSKVVANYYWQWWTDDELTNFINKGAEAVSQWTNAIPDNAFLQIPPGLKMAALYVGASMGLDSLIIFLVNRRHSQEFLLEEDGNDDNKFSQTIAAMQKLSESFHKKGLTQRDDFYKRQGKREAPAFGVKTVATRRYGSIR